MASQWYYKFGKIVVGPLSPDELRVRVESGDVRAKTLVRKEADGNWVPAAMVEGLLNRPVKPVPPVDIPATPVDSPAAETIPVALPIPDSITASPRSRHVVRGLMVVAICLMVIVGILVVRPGRSAQDDQIALMQAQLEKLQELIRAVDAQKAAPAAIKPAEVPVPEKADVIPEPEPEPQPIPLESVEDAGPKEIPAELLQQAEAAKKARIDDQKRQQARLLQRIYEQRTILTERWSDARQKAQQLLDGISAAETDLARCEKEGAALRQNAAILQRQVKDIQDTLLFEKDPSRRAQLQGLLTAGTTAYAQGQARYQTLDAEAGRARLNHARLVPQVQAASAEVSRLYQQAEQLRQEWLNATDAFGKLVNGDYAAAVTDFSEWIILEPTSAIPYAARGLAHHYGGKPDLARLDFQQASRIDPALTAKMIRDFQDFLNGVQPQQNPQPKKRARKR